MVVAFGEGTRKKVSSVLPDATGRSWLLKYLSSIRKICLRFRKKTALYVP
jgi:hypothetical protein